MGLFQDVLEGFVTGFVSVTADHMRHGRALGHSSHGTVQIERLCREVGWEVDEREANAVILHFTDPVARIRKLSVSGGDTGKVALFSSCSSVVIPARQVQANVLAHLLVRNGEMTTGAWQANVMGSGGVGFVVKYFALVAGLDASIFKQIGEGLVREASDFDGKMHAADLM